jgi:hypothetical protein
MQHASCFRLAGLLTDFQDIVSFDPTSFILDTALACEGLNRLVLYVDNHSCLGLHD